MGQLLTEVGSVWQELRVRVMATGVGSRGLGAETFPALGWLDLWLVMCRERARAFHLFPFVNSVSGCLATSTGLGVCTLSLRFWLGLWVTKTTSYKGKEQPTTIVVVQLSQMTNYTALFFLRWITFVVLTAVTQMQLWAGEGAGLVSSVSFRTGQLGFWHVLYHLYFRRQVT